MSCNCLVEIALLNPFLANARFNLLSPVQNNASSARLKAT